MYGTTLKLSEEVLKKVLPSFKEKRKDFKKVRGIFIK
jgi:hypothetical protein